MKVKNFLVIAATTTLVTARLPAQQAAGDINLLKGRLEKQLAEISALDAEIQSLSQLLGREGTPLPRREPAKPAPPPEVVPEPPAVVTPVPAETPAPVEPQIRQAVPVDKSTPPRPTPPPPVIAVNPAPAVPTPPPLPPPPAPVPEPVAPPMPVTPVPVTPAPAVTAQEIPLPPVELPQPGPPTLVDQPDPILPPPVPQTAVKGNEYTVQPGDSFSSIARKTKFSVNALVKANPNVVPEKLQLGQKLRLPSGSEAAAPATMRPAPLPEPAEHATRPEAESTTSEKIHVVQSGDTLHGIAQRSGTTVEAISKLNGITNPAALKLGTKLKLPGSGKVRSAPDSDPGEPAEATPKSPARATTPGSHVVKPGETLYSISRKTGTPIEELRKVNGLKDDTIHPGQSLKVRRGNPAPAEPRPDSASTSPARGAATVLAAAPAGSLAGSTKTISTTGPKTLPVVVRASSAKTPAKPPVAQGVQMTEYTVMPGESLFTIARRHFLSREELASMNSMQVDLPLHAGQKIRLPVEAVSSREMAENESPLR